MPNKILKILFLYNGIFVLGGSLLGPLYTVFVQGINKEIFSISISWATFLLSATVFTYIVSRIKDKVVSKRVMLCLGYGFRAACWLSFIFVTNLHQLVIIQFFLGIGEALGTPAFEAVFAEHLDRNRHLMDYSDWKVIANGVLVAGTLLGGLIVNYFGFNYLFLLMGLLALLSLAGIALNPSLDLKVNSVTQKA
jgi:MFS family permease